MMNLRFATSAATGAVVVHMLAMFAPAPSSAAWGWMTTEKEAPDVMAKMKDALWYCQGGTVGIGGGMSDQFMKANNLKYGDEALTTFLTEKCTCRVLPKPGYKCDIAQMLLVGKAKAGHKSLAEGDVIMPGKLGPECTNTGYPGATIDCELKFDKDPVCSAEDLCDPEKLRKEGYYPSAHPH